MTAKPLTTAILRRRHGAFLAFRSLADLLAEERAAPPSACTASLAASESLPPATHRSRDSAGPDTAASLRPAVHPTAAGPWTSLPAGAAQAAEVRPNPGLPGPLPRALRPVRLAMQLLPNRTQPARSGTGSTSRAATAVRPSAAPVARPSAASARTLGSSRPSAAVARGDLASGRAAGRSSAAAQAALRRAQRVLPLLPRVPRASQLPTARNPSAPNTTSPWLPTAAGLPADRRSLLPGFQERSDVHVASVRVDGLCPGSLGEARGLFSGSAECTDQ